MPDTSLKNGKGRVSLWRLRVIILFFFFVLAALGLFIAKQAVDQLQWEAFYRFQTQAIEFSERIERELRNLIQLEDQRSFGDYQFAVARGDVANAYVQPSPLADLELTTNLPGLVGYFQLNQQNHFSSPLVPQMRAQASSFGLSANELAERERRQRALKNVLLENKLLSDSPTAGREESLLDNLAAEKLRQEMQLRKSKQSQSLKDLQLDDSLRKKSMAKSRQSPALEEKKADKPEPSSGPQPLLKERVVSARVEKELLYEQVSQEEGGQEEERVSARTDDQIFNVLESRIGSFSVVPLESGHLLFFRQVWQQNERFLQGFVAHQQDFLQGLLAKEFETTSLADMSTLAVAWQDQLISTFRRGLHSRSYLSSERQLGGAVLHKQALPPPMGDWELIFTIDHLPAGAASRVILFSASSFLLLLALGCYLIYRLVVKQMRLASQQQNFVSSISHELKTPLTSIRMYGEMLKQGWVSEDKKNEYYDFIFQESERLSRLINNILQMARMTRSELPVNFKICAAAELLDLIRSSISTQVSAAGFQLELQALDDPTEDKPTEVRVDPDLFLQVMINLVDNALKFARKAEDKRVIIAFETQRGQLRVSVRDFGPGIALADRKRIFDLFYRAENELTRETKGTGIGLALVSELLTLMGANIEVHNCEPGVVFILLFPLLNRQAG